LFSDITAWLSASSLDLLQYVAVFAIGSLVGIGELVARYKDAPRAALVTRPAQFYIGINAVAAVLALVAIRSLGLKFGLGEDPARVEAVYMVQALGAGFGAMSIFRSSAFVTRVADQDVAIGPSAFLNVVLSAADRAVDRQRATARAMSVAASMSSISFEQTQVSLPTLALALMQNLPEEDQKQLAKQLELLQQRENINDATKSLCMGLSLMNVVGEDVLTAAVEALRNTLTTGGDPSKVSPKPVRSLLTSLGIRTPLSAEVAGQALITEKPEEQQKTADRHESAGQQQAPADQQRLTAAHEDTDQKPAAQQEPSDQQNLADQQKPSDGMSADQQRLSDQQKLTSGTSDKKGGDTSPP
jgi:hypothetical protein